MRPKGTVKGNFKKLYLFEVRRWGRQGNLVESGKRGVLFRTNTEMEGGKDVAIIWHFGLAMCLKRMS